MSIPQKTQRKTRNLGLNTAATQEESYAAIEAVSGCIARCSDGSHQGDRNNIPIRDFYLNKGGKGLQGACITCQKNRRRNRITRSRAKFAGKEPAEVRDMYVAAYGPTKTCSKCGEARPPTDFIISISMECGLHNHCIPCCIGNSQGNGGLRDFIFMPDKDGIKYVKKATCEICGGTNKLAVDHIVPIAKGGTDCITNKQTLCVHCNSRKSDTLDGVTVTEEKLCERYRGTIDLTLPAAQLTQALAKQVYEFRKKNIEEPTLAEVRATLQAYTKRYNMGHNLTRIIGKIAGIFGKSR